MIKSDPSYKINLYFPWSEENRKNCIEAYTHGYIPQVYLELGRRCTLKCKYCDSPNRDYTKDALSLDEIYILLSKLQDMGLQFIFICGYGEPFEDERILPILRFAHQRHIHVSIFSNLQPIYRSKEIFQNIVELKPNILAKCDSLNRKIFDSMLGIKGTAQKIYDTIFDLCNSNFLNIHNGTTNLGLSIVPTTLNISTIIDIVEYAIKIGAYPCIGELESQYEYVDNNQLILKKEKIKQLKSKIKRKYDFIYERPLCQGVFCGLHVNEKGDCVIDMNTGLSCGWFLPETNYKTIGNLKNESIQSIWRKVIERRIMKLDETVSNIKIIQATIGLGGGGIPSQWTRIYYESTTQLINKSI